jgi:hypothetical protein
MSGFDKTSGNAATTDASGIWPAPADEYSAEDITILVDRAKRLRAQAIRNWGRQFVQTFASLWRRPGRLMPQPAR